MFRFNDITITPNKEGMIITNGSKETQVYLAKERTERIPYEHTEWDLLSDETIAARAARDKAGKLFSACSTKEQGQHVLDEHFEKLMNSFQAEHDERFIDDETRKGNISPRVKKFRKELAIETKERIERYKTQKESKSYLRREVSFTIGDDETIHTYSCGIDGEISVIDVGLSILDNVMHIDEFDGLDTLATGIDFMNAFGYDCDNQEKGVEIIESILKMGTALGFPIPVSNVPIGVWRSNGIGKGDKDRIQKGLLPKGDAEYNTLYITIKWKDSGEEDEMKAGFYGEDETPEDLVKDESIFCYFVEDEEIMGDRGDFTVTGMRWE